MRSFLALLLALVAAPALADPAPFDLAGPALRVSVTHGTETLPVAQVPQLAVGDRIAVVTDFPRDQAAHYVLVAAFLRGTTNPPPDDWFFHADSWTKKGRAGLALTVPAGAQQVVLFLAPATGGDFPTLRNAVQGKPGAFVRAAQELAQAALDRARLDAYLHEVRRIVPGDPNRLERITPLLARSLQIKVNTDCFARMPELQAACLQQNQDSLVLNDGHSNALTDTVGSTADLALQFSYTPQGGLGYYSPYIAAIRDVIGILSSIHTAKYQYFPAIGMPDGDRLRMVLNAAPSFHNPKSVLVTALPVVGPVRVPPLQLADAASSSLCAADPRPLLPLSGAPLLYATSYAHDLVLRATLPGGGTVDLPATPDVAKGGLLIDVAGRLPAGAGPIEAKLHGRWGFEPFDGPAVTLQPFRPGGWKAAEGTDAGTLALTGGTAACVTGVTLRADGGGNAQTLKWTVAGRQAITVTLPATAEAKRPALTLSVAGPPGTAPDIVERAGPPAPPRFGASLLARAANRSDDAAPIRIRLDGDDDLPAEATVTLSLKAASPARFSGRELVEVQAGDGTPVALTPGHGLRLADAQVALLNFSPAALLGPSVYGPLRVRVVRDGAAGDWIPVGTLVRLPVLHGLQCASDASAACELSGDGLFLLAAVAARPDFNGAALVPEGFPGTVLAVPHPGDKGLYVRLHDDPAAVARIGG